MFVDLTQLTLHAGKGGNGVIAWHRAKFLPKGGPTGGDGGWGGSVFLIADRSVRSLEGYRNKKIWIAPKGADGGSNLKQGKKGADLTLKVPCGTLIKDLKSQEVLFDLVEHGQKILLCRGGRPGKGNHHFKSSTNQAPHVCTEGLPGESKDIILELKLIADVGLVGMPNAGKSSLLAALSTHAPKVGAYPFTTLVPNLGYLKHAPHRSILLADIPGIIQDAHLNKGLGLAFLKHIERTSLLVFVVDISGWEERDPLEDFRILQKEIDAYNPEILTKPFLVVLNKIDIEESVVHIERFYTEFPNITKERILPLSAQQEQGVDALIVALQTMLPNTKE